MNRRHREDPELDQWEVAVNSPFKQHTSLSLQGVIPHLGIQRCVQKEKCNYQRKWERQEKEKRQGPNKVVLLLERNLNLRIEKTGP
jgi:hypothetical protein